MASPTSNQTGTTGEYTSIPLKTSSAPSRTLRIHHGLRETKTTLVTSLRSSVKTLPTEMRLYLKSYSVIKSLSHHPRLTFFVTSGDGSWTPINSCWRHGVMHNPNTTKCSCLSLMSELRSSPLPTCESCGNVQNSLKLVNSTAKLLKMILGTTSLESNIPNQKSSGPLYLSSPKSSSQCKPESQVLTLNPTKDTKQTLNG